MNTNQQLFAKLRAKYAAFYDVTGRIHEGILAEGKSTHGHGRDHDLMVAQYAAIIAEDEWTGELAWVAGLMHSFDRHFSPELAAGMLSSCIDYLKTKLLEENILLIENAVKNHSKLNGPNDSPVLVALKDADRLANIGAVNLIRGGQHRPDIPASIPETMGALHPLSTFKKPKCCYDATFYNLEWESMLRLPKAKELGAKYFAFIREFQRLALVQQEEIGLYPWPEVPAVAQVGIE